MNFQEVIVVARIHHPDGRVEPVEVDVTVIAGSMHMGSVESYLQENHPKCKVEIVDTRWVIRKRIL